MDTSSRGPVRTGPAQASLVRSGDAILFGGAVVAVALLNPFGEVSPSRLRRVALATNLGKEIEAFLSFVMSISVSAAIAHVTSWNVWSFQVLAVLLVGGTNLGILHQIPEGYVGVYWRGGALLRQTSRPGFHLMIPFVTRVEPIQVTIQTDEVQNIPCGTKGGVMIYFDKIEVVNRLNREHVYETILNYGVSYDKIWIYNKIHHEINQFCSSHSLQEVYIDTFDQIDEKVKEEIQRDCTKYAPGIEIISVRVTKPSIPQTIARNYESMEEERTKVLIAVEKQKVVEKEAETVKKRALTEAEQAAQVSRILMEQRVMEKESIRRQELIENEIFLSRRKSVADADFYRELKEAEANRLKLTPQFLELRFIEAIASNTKIFFGDKVPSMVLDQRFLGNFFDELAQTNSRPSTIEE